MMVKSHQPTSVLELGSGASTIAIPYMLERWGQGSMISIDHDADFAEKTRHYLSVHEHQNISLHHCALSPVTVNGTDYRWYDLSQVPIPDMIDLLIVDGPPLQTNPLARFPALPLLWDRLSDGAIILMDDADRKDEQEIVRRWSERYPIEVVERHASLKGFLALKVRKSEIRSRSTAA
jgi:predicted O-methyltransferase YrrM